MDFKQSIFPYKLQVDNFYFSNIIHCSLHLKRPSDKYAERPKDMILNPIWCKITYVKVFFSAYAPHWIESLDNLLSVVKSVYDELRLL